MITKYFSVIRNDKQQWWHMNLQRTPLPWNISWRHPLITKKALWRKKFKWASQSKVESKHKCKWKLLMQNLSKSLHAVLLIFGTAISNRFDNLAHLSINHLVTNRSICTNISKLWLSSVSFVAITKCWCLFGLWQPTLPNAFTQVNKSVCVCQTNLYLC